ncbi:MAG: ketopantoate reductase family protein [Burkholderiales bacterium]
MKIAVMGTGGVGGYFGGRLAASGEDVTFIARGEHLKAIQANGLQVLSATGDFVVKPARATDDPSKVGAAGVVMIAVKLWATDEAIAAIAPMMGPNSVAVSFQNGVIAKDKLIAAYGRQRVWGGVSNIAALIEKPGVIRHNGPMAILVPGELEGGRTPRLEAFIKACEKAKIETRVPENIDTAIWEKYIFLAAMSSMTALTRLPVGAIREDPDTRALLVQLMSEVQAVGRAKGVKLDDGTLDRLTTRMDGLPRPMVASMLGDLERGNRLELPWLAGGVVEMGKPLGVPTPAAKFVYTALKLYANGRPADSRN